MPTPAIGEEVQLTPEQQAQYEQLSAPTSNEVDPIRDFNSQQLSELAVKDPSFNLVEAFRQHPDKSPEVVQKVADAHDAITKRGFQLSDLPNPVKAVPQAVYEFGKGILKQAWNYANAGAAAIAGATVGGAAENEMIQEAQRRVGENIAGTEQAVTGLSNQIQATGRKAANLVTGGAQTPEERVKNLWDAVGRGEVAENISKGHGAFMSGVGGNVVQELEQAGKPIRPEEVNTLAQGDPFTFWSFGKVLGGAGRLAGNIPGVQAATSKVGAALSTAAATGVGKTIQVAAPAIKAGGKTAEFLGGGIKTVGPLVQGLEALATGNVSHAAEGVGSYYGGSALQWIGQQAVKKAQPIKQFGKQITGEIPLTSPSAQVVKDVAQALPGAAGEVAKGAALDLGLAAATSESPEQTQNALGLGTAFGALSGAGRTLGHVVSGQIIAPRSWGNPTPVAPSGNFPSLNSAHSQAYASAPVGVQTRINAIRQFAKMAAPGTDVYYVNDKPALSKALVDSGVAPATADLWSKQLGFFSTDLTGKDGQQHPVLVVTDADAAPHESFHAFQDVLGEEGNRAIDEIVKKDYGDRWEQEGRRYTERAAQPSGVEVGPDWRSTLLDLTGWGRSEAIEKLTSSLENQLTSEGQEPNADFIRQRVDGEWNRLREQAKANNPQATPAELESSIWRDVLSPDEAKDTADRYIARELAAENFDAIFKAQGPGLVENKSLPGQLARVVAKVMSALGSNPLAGRQTQIGKVEPRFQTTEAVRKAVLEQQPPATPSAAATPEKPTPSTPTPSAPTPAPAPSPSPEAEKIRDWTAKNPPTVPDRLRAADTIANAIDNEQTVQVIYWGAKGEQGGSIESVRPERRAEIEAQREAGNEDRPLVQKTFFPERVEMTGKGPQIVGWSPDNFYANANKFAQWIDQVGDAARQKFALYRTDGNGNFTEDGWRYLQHVLNAFMQNQRAGATGAGEPLIVPKETLARGFTQPKKEGTVTHIDQGDADVINYLFHVQIPESTSRVAPLHIAGQEISEATQPSRLQIPVRPRGEYTEAQLSKANIAGPRGVREVNPLRNWIEQAAKSSGVEAPSLIDVSQRLNLSRIADATTTPEVAPVRGNTLTLAAGFQPPSLSDEPEAIKIAAIRLPNGKVYEADNYGYPTHGGALAKARQAGEDIPQMMRRNVPGIVEGFVTNSGEFLNRKEAFKRAKEYGQITGEEFFPRPGELESVSFERTAHGQFQPPQIEEIERMSPEEFTKWAESLSGNGGFTSVAYKAGLRAFEAGPEAVAGLLDAYDRATAQAKALFKTDIQAAMTTSFKGQYFREAWEAATGLGSGGEMLRKLKAGQFQPQAARELTPEEEPSRSVPSFSTVRRPEEQPAQPAGAARPFLPSKQAEPAPSAVKLPTAVPAAPQVQTEEEKKRAQFQGQTDVRDVAEKYAKSAGIEGYSANRNFEPVPEDLARKLADHYESAKSDPKNADVQKSYAALTDETVRQFHAIENAGYQIEPFTGTGEPYKSSADMVKDVRENKHLFYLPTKEAGALGKDNPMMTDSGIEINGERLPVNDVFRAVHDFFGHAKEGFQFGPRGEFNAWREHSEMYSPDAQGALAAETLAQNFWVNYGKHLRTGPEGRIPAKGEEGHVAPPNRPFAEQKNVVIPEKFLEEARSAFKQPEPTAQLQPKSEEDFKMPKGTAGGFKKAWITPDGAPVQLGGQWHSDWLDQNRNMLEQKYGITGLPKFEGTDTEVAREKALAAGFARLNYAINSGKLTVEARDADWKNLKEPVRHFAEANLDDLDNMSVHLLDNNLKDVTRSKSAQLFKYGSDAEKLANLPLPDVGEAPSMEAASERLFQKAVKGQLQPNEEQTTLFGEKNKEPLTGAQVSGMTRDELLNHYPEAIVPRKRDDTIPSEITKSPLYKQSRNEPEAVKAFGEKLADFYNSVKDNPATQAGAKWYSDFVPRLKKEFGKNAPLMAELLAATSPRTNVETNFGYAYDALKSFEAGRFDKIIAKFNQGMDMITDDRWLSWYNRELNAGNIPNPPQEPTPAAFLEHWIFTHNLKPTQSNGKLYGTHSIPVLKVFARRWMDENTGPKTRTFVSNLTGMGHEATIDMWADRTMRRLGYEGYKDRWRILPQNLHSVSDEDFYFSQKAFRDAAERVGIQPDAMQGALWFAEKQLWADNGWAKLDLGDFSKELEKVPMLKRAFEQKLAKTKEQGKVKAGTEGELFGPSVTPRPKL
jgi:hypothetical protein